MPRAAPTARRSASAASRELMPHIKGDWAARGELITLWRPGRSSSWPASSAGYTTTPTSGAFARPTCTCRARTPRAPSPRWPATTCWPPTASSAPRSTAAPPAADQAHRSLPPGAAHGHRQARSSAPTTACWPTSAAWSVLDTNSQVRAGHRQARRRRVAQLRHRRRVPRARHQRAVRHHGTPAWARAPRRCMLMITTSGSNIGGPCYQHQVELQKILEGVLGRRHALRHHLRHRRRRRLDAARSALHQGQPQLRRQRRSATSCWPPRREAVRGPAQGRPSSRPSTSTSGSAPRRRGSTSRRLQHAADPALSEEDFRGEDLLDRHRPGQQERHRQQGQDLPAPDRGRLALLRLHAQLAARGHRAAAEHGHYQAWVQQGYLVQTPGQHDRPAGDPGGHRARQRAARRGRSGHGRLGQPARSRRPCRTAASPWSTCR